MRSYLFVVLNGERREIFYPFVAQKAPSEPAKTIDLSVSITRTYCILKQFVDMHKLNFAIKYFVPKISQNLVKLSHKKERKKEP